MSNPTKPLAEEISNAIFALAGSIGLLAQNIVDIQANMITDVLHQVFILAGKLNVNLVMAVEQKIEINKLKCPKELCHKEVAIKKHTECTQSTGIKNDSDVKLNITAWSKTSVPLEIVRSNFQQHLPVLLASATECSMERGWIGSYSTQSLVCSLFCEMAELMELIQWKDMSNIDTYGEARDGLTRELADITIYCIHFGRELGIFTQQAAHDESINKQQFY